MSGRTDTDRLEWLIQRIKVAEIAILETIDEFEQEGRLSKARGANDALDALRFEFSCWISELSAEKVDEGMDIEEALLEVMSAEVR